MELYSNTLKQYLTIKAPLGEGHFGKTVLVTDQKNREYVLKILKITDVDPQKSISRFQREINILKKLNYPGIPKYYDLIVTGETIAILQQYIPGESCHQLIKSQKTISRDRIRALLKEGLEILNYLYQQTPRVLHRDISPDNMIIDPDGHLWLVDFGGAILMTDHEGRSLSCIGTFGYMAPEQLYGDCSTGSDLYALGLSLLAVSSKKSAHQFPVNGVNGLIEVNEALDTINPIDRAVFKRLTHWNKRERFKKPEEVLKALRYGIERPSHYWPREKGKIQVEHLYIFEGLPLFALTLLPAILLPLFFPREIGINITILCVTLMWFQSVFRFNVPGIKRLRTIQIKEGKIISKENAKEHSIELSSDKVTIEWDKRTLFYQNQKLIRVSDPQKAIKIRDQLNRLIEEEYEAFKISR